MAMVLHYAIDVVKLYQLVLLKTYIVANIVKTNIKISNQMLTIEKYLSYVFEVVRINAQLEELRRIEPSVPSNVGVQRRMNFLHAKKDRVMQILDKAHKPIEMAPVEQYIDIELQYTE